MTTITKDLGPVTAYAYAVEGGYTGTEEEFTEALGEAADAVDQIANLSAEATTLSAGSSATASYDDGVITFGIPKGDKGDTGNSIASISKTSTSGIVDTYTITYTGGQSSDTFTVTNGNGITNITLNNDYTLTITTNTGSYTTSESIRGETGNGISDISKTGTSGNVDTYTITFTDGNSTTFEVTNGSVTSVNGRTGDVEGIAEDDGYYESMTVGNAEQLVSTVFVEDSVPYNFRTSGGSADIGDREYDEVVGGTVAWNQLIDLETFTNTTTDTREYLSFRIRLGATSSYAVNENVVSPKKIETVYNCAGTVERIRIYHNGLQTNILIYDDNSFQWISGHKYLILMDITGADPTVVGGVSCKNNMVFDLTQMFGSTIADYIYTLEQNTAGSGVAWFRKLFPKDYYAYNVGQLMSVKTSGHNMVGFNAWDEQWELGLYSTSSGNPVSGSSSIRSKSTNYIHVVPSTSYYFKTSNKTMEVYQYDGNKNYISKFNVVDQTATINANCHYIRFDMAGSYGTTYKNDICINLSWDGERDGEYEPYELHSYPLDSDLELRGIPKLDSNNKLYYDGDVYESDGTVTRKYYEVLVDGTNHYFSPMGGGSYWHLAPYDYPTIARSQNSSIPRTVITAFTVGTANWGTSDGTPRHLFTRASNWTGVYNSIEEFNAYFTAHPQKIVYELATPTTESAEPFISPQVVDDFGTEEYVDYAYSQNLRDVQIPVGHNTKYTNNLRAKLEMAPESPDGDGDYIVRQTDGENAYVALSDSTIIQALQTKLPNAPSTDGSYLLNATVNGSTNTYAWSQGSVSKLESDIARNTFYILDLYNKISEVPSTATYNEIASVVQNGDAPRLFKTGIQITANYNDGTNSYLLPWDIVACRNIVDANGVTKPGMIIQSHYAMQECQFDQNEGFFVVPAGGLSANTFHFTMGNAWGSNVVKDKVYQFTTTEDYAEGDIWQLGKATSETSGMPDTSPSDWRVRTYKAANGVSAGAVATATEILTLSEGSGGTDLGTLSSSTKYGASGLNNMQRAAYGYNRWGQSGIRQWLNSSAVAGAWWTSQNPYDRAPSQLSSMRGFMAGFDNDFLSIIKPVTITTVLNTVTDTDIGASETTVDTFFLPSLEEEYIVPQVSGVEGAYWPYWKDRLGLNSPQGTGSSYANTNHIGYRYDSKTSAVNCRLRSAYRSNAFYTWNVHSSGTVYYYYATSSYRPRPACIIY